MSLMMGMGGGGGGKPPSPLIAGSGKWLSTFVGLYAAVFLTVDVWAFFEPRILDMIYARYEGGLANALYWVLRLAAYPAMFFAVKMGVGIVFVSAVMWIMSRLFGQAGGGRR
jgi:hypothetical protein